METTHRGDLQRSAERRRYELLEAADRVVLRDGPGASMNAIAAEAGITKPILYRHFGDKGGLYAALAERHTDGLLASLRAALDAPVGRRERIEAFDARADGTVRSEGAAVVVLAPLRTALER
ncbi:TetR/AcrR family transcriptional regulator, partial [Streptomyces sp. NPDC002454]